MSETSSTQKPSDLTPQQRYYLRNKELVKKRAATWQQANPEAYRASKKKWRAANPDKVKAQERRDRAAKLQRTYGVSKQDMLIQQGGRCAICSTDKPPGKGWHLDHDHNTGQARRVLCHHCNTGLGHFKDNPAILAAAIAYLERHNGGQ